MSPKKNYLLYWGHRSPALAWAFSWGRATLFAVTQTDACTYSVLIKILVSGLRENFFLWSRAERVGLVLGVWRA